MIIIRSSEFRGGRRVPGTEVKVEVRIENE
jgi:hypothetical protein